MKKLKITFNAPVTLGFALVSLVVLGLNILTRGRSNSLLFSTYHSSLLSPLTYLRFVTHVLGHSGWQHYAGNMMYSCSWDLCWKKSMARRKSVLPY